MIRPTLDRTILAPVLAGLLALLQAGSAPPLAAEPPPDLAALKRAINQEVRAARQVAPATGVHIVEIDEANDDSREIYSFEADVPRILASNTKLFTTAAALDRLGPGFFFETPLLARGAIRDGVLWGDLAVVGGGDPNISGRHTNGESYAVFREWAAKLEALGIRRVDGDIYLVHGLFDDQLVHPDWPEDQLDRWYEAPVAALSFNDNCVLVKVEPIPDLERPGGGEARVGLVPDLPSLRLAAQVRIVGDRRRERVSISRTPVDADPESPPTFRATGSIHPATEKIDRWVPVADPVAYFGAALVDALREEGLRIDAPPRAVESLPASRPGEPGGTWRTLAVHRTDLLTTLEVINERSQNFYAESVLKLLGARLCDDGSWAGGLRAVSDFLEANGLDAEALADGSGMSRGNRASARQLTRLLRHMYGHPHRGEWLRTLPYSGQVDLRWERRLAEPPYRGNVLAKTGTLNGVSTLSGYAKGRSGRVYAFSLLMNRSRANWRAQKAQDAILRALVDHG